MNSPLFFIYCPKCGKKALERNEKDKMQHCTQCDFVFYFHTPQTAAAIVENAKAEVLLVQRSAPPFQNLWSLPSGFCHFGEHPFDTAIRELREETGLQAVYDRLVDVFLADDHPQTFSLLTIIKVKDVLGTVKANDDAQKAAFFAYDNLPPLAFKAHIAALQTQHSFSSTQR